MNHRESAWGASVVVEVEKTIQPAGFYVRGVAANPSKVRVVLDEAEDRRLIGDAVVDLVLLGIRRDHQ